MNAANTYRVEALLELAAAFPRPLTTGALAARRQVPRAFLARLLGSLAEAGLVITGRGPSGGTRLALRPEDVSLAAVLPAMPRRAAPRGGRGVAYLADRLAAARSEVLHSLSLAALRDVERSTAGADDWQI